MKLKYYLYPDTFGDDVMVLEEIVPSLNCEPAVEYSIADLDKPKRFEATLNPDDGMLELVEVDKETHPYFNFRQFTLIVPAVEANEAKKTAEEILRGVTEWKAMTDE